MKKLLLFFLFVNLLSMASCQEKQTYWEIDNIYKEDGAPFRGMTYAMMEAIYNTHIHFKKNGNVLEFDFPDKNTVLMDTLKSLSNERFPEDFYVEEYRSKLTDSIYFIGIEKGAFKIKFINSWTGDKDKRTVIEFKKLSEKEYYKQLENLDSIRKEQIKLVNIAIEAFKKDSLWLVEPSKTERKEFEIFDEAFTLELPEEYNIIASGGIYSRKFDSLRVGYATDNELDDYFCISKSDWREFDDPKIIFSVAQRNSFNFDRYINNEYKPEKILYKTENSFVAVDFSVDDETGEAKLDRIILFKYFYLKGTFVIFSNDLSIKGNDLSLAKEQFALMQSLFIK